MKRFGVFFAAASLSMMGVTAASADTIQPDSGLFIFSFGAVGSSLGELDFTLSKTATLTISDLYFSGDQFLITNNGSLLGITSEPTPGHYVGADFAAALADPYFSKAVFTLDPGTYSLSGTVLANAPGYEAGSGGLTLSTVPLPASAPMFGAALLGLAALGYVARRKKGVVAA